MHKLEQPKRRARIAPVSSNLSHSLQRGLLPLFIHFAKDMCSFTDLEQDGQDDRLGSLTITFCDCGKGIQTLIPLKGETAVVYFCISYLEQFFLLLNKLRTLSYILAPPFWVFFKRGLVGSKWLSMQWFHFIWRWRGRKESENEEKLMSHVGVSGHAPFTLEGENEMAKSTSQSVYIALSILMLFFLSHQPPSFLSFPDLS